MNRGSYFHHDLLTTRLSPRPPHEETLTSSSPSQRAISCLPSAVLPRAPGTPSDLDLAGLPPGRRGSPAQVGQLNAVGLGPTGNVLETQTLRPQPTAAEAPGGGPVACMSPIHPGNGEAPYVWDSWVSCTRLLMGCVLRGRSLNPATCYPCDWSKRPHPAVGALPVSGGYSAARAGFSNAFHGRRCLVPEVGGRRGSLPAPGAGAARGAGQQRWAGSRVPDSMEAPSAASPPLLTLLTSPEYTVASEARGAAVGKCVLSRPRRRGFRGSGGAAPRGGEGMLRAPVGPEARPAASAAARGPGHTPPGSSQPTQSWE